MLDALQIHTEIITCSKPPPKPYCVDVQSSIKVETTDFLFHKL